MQYSVAQGLSQIQGDAKTACTDNDTALFVYPVDVINLLQ